MAPIRQSPARMNRTRANSGYSLVELLVVVGLIGIFTLVVIPNFMTMRQSMKVKSAIRKTMSAMQSARQLAISRSQMTKVTYTTGAAAHTFEIFTSTDSDPATATWTAVNRSICPTCLNPVVLDNAVYINSTTFTDVNNPVDGKVDIVFHPNGTIDPIPVETENGAQVTKLVLRTDWKVPTNEYDIYFYATGGFKSVSKTF